jgi:MSHA biogenesis protein MshP
MSRSLQRGASLATAIFLIVILAALGAYIATVSSLHHTSAVLDLQGSRAYQAAKSGIEWGAYQVFQNSAGAFATNCNAGPATQSLSGLAGTLADFTVTVACSSVQFSEITAATGRVYVLTATACNQPTGGNCPGTLGQRYVERQLQATVGR